jgi:hypothetical protein
MEEIAIDRTPSPRRLWNVVRRNRQEEKCHDLEGGRTNLVKVRDRRYGDWYALLLAEHEDICILGCASIAPLSNGIRIFGYEWVSTEDNVDIRGMLIFSTKSHGCLIIESLLPQISTTTTRSTCRLSMNTCHPAFDRHLVHLCRDYFIKLGYSIDHSVLLAIRPVNYKIPSMDRLGSKLLLDIFGEQSRNPLAQLSSSPASTSTSSSTHSEEITVVESIPGLHIISQFTSGLSGLIPYQSWVDTVKAWQEPIISGQSRIMAVCGGKGVGKSSFCRFAINWLLNSREKVYFLDCDLGQSEAFPPGLVSLHEIRLPLLGPPFSHLQTPIR